MKAPWPVSVLGIGDSYTSNTFPGTGEWAQTFGSVWPNCTLVNEGTSSKSLFDTSGPLGADTIRNSIDADLAANPNADVVVWATFCANDVLRRIQGLNALTSADLITPATYVLDAIATANKRAIIMNVPMAQAFIAGFGGNTIPNATAGWTLRTEMNTWLQGQCAARGFVYWDPKWYYNDFGPETVSSNGILAEYSSGDSLHPNDNGGNRMREDVMAILKSMNWRKAAA